MSDQMVPLKRGDFVCMLTTSKVTYQDAKRRPETMTTYRIRKVRGVSDGFATSYFDLDETPRVMSREKIERTWAIQADEVDAEALWSALKEHGYESFGTMEAVKAFLVQFKKEAPCQT